MSFGPIMRFKVDELQIELAPLTKEAVSEFIGAGKPGGMQLYSITKYLVMNAAPTLEDEVDWFEKTRADRTSLIWGIWIVKDKERILIGNTGFHALTRNHIHQATSGSMIFRQEYWGKGIASAAHKARTWYGFHQLGLHRIMSAVVQGNGGSRKALWKSGYDLVYVERNTVFVDGQLRHQDNLECLNPNDAFWTQWWHGERPTKRALEARQRTIEALTWATQHVELA